MTSDFLVCDKMSSMKLHGFPDNPGCRDLAVLILLLNLEYILNHKGCVMKRLGAKNFIEGFLWSADFGYLKKSDFVSQLFDAFIKFLS